MNSATTIIGIDCSPRMSSNSGRLLRHVLALLESDQQVGSIEQPRLADVRVDCLGCEQCYSAVGHHSVDCVHGGADVILMATPTCFGMPPALAVALLDRSDSLWRDGHRLKGKLGGVIVNGATVPADDPSLRECADAVTRFFEQHEMSCVQPVNLGGTLAYADQRFPDPLPTDATDVLCQMAGEIVQWPRNRRHA